jgi:hypothetical protein
MSKYEDDGHNGAYREGREEAEDANLLDDVLHGIGEMFNTVLPESTERQSYERGYWDKRKEDSRWW